MSRVNVAGKMKGVDTVHYQIGVVRVALSSPVREIVRQHRSLYRDFVLDAPRAVANHLIHVHVDRTGFSFRHRKRFVVSVNHRQQFEPARRDEVLPYVEWAINWALPRTMPDYLQLHASTLEVGGAGVMLAGDSGSGKSTLAVGLLAGGWHYLCDEFALLDTADRLLHPYPRAICIKRPSFDAVASVDVPMHRERHHFKGSKGYVGFVNPLRIRRDCVGEACPVRYVIFPKYAAGAEPELIPMTRAEAAFALHRVCFNLLDHGAHGLDALAGVVRGATCYRLVAGDLGRTCDVLRCMVDAQTARRVRIA